jgi:hypothetical protein
MPAIKKRVSFPTQRQQQHHPSTKATTTTAASISTDASTTKSSPLTSPTNHRKGEEGRLYCCGIRQPICPCRKQNRMEDSNNDSSNRLQQQQQQPPPFPDLNGEGLDPRHHHHHHSPHSPAHSSPGLCGWFSDLSRELVSSSELLFQNKLNWLLLLGPIALLGDATGWLGEPICFAFSGIALIPCAER